MQREISKSKLRNECFKSCQSYRMTMLMLPIKTVKWRLDERKVWRDLKADEMMLKSTSNPLFQVSLATHLNTKIWFKTISTKLLRTTLSKDQRRDRSKSEISRPSFFSQELFYPTFFQEENKSLTWPSRRNLIKRLLKIWEK